tara:strand:+ start:23729 stop:24124 length:396 start_codon:yes stop_codon:yes gene_type:complete
MYIYDMKIIRRIVAIFLIISATTGLIDELTTYGDISDESIGGLVITTFLVYLLLRKSKQKSNDSVQQYQKIESTEESKIIENESIKNRKILNNLSMTGNNKNTNTTSGYSPINDRETFITRIFKVKSNRIG